MRFGLVGTGPWARSVHGPGLVASEHGELVGVWGRDPAKAAAVAEELGTATFESYAALLADVDAVAFAVPPAVQAELALEAAKTGRHLLLDKPVATSATAARALAEEAARRSLASVVFFTDRFSAEATGWLDELHRAGGWRGGAVRWLACLDTPGNPYASSAWRRVHGALWDIGPHALATLDAALGPIEAVTAVGGEHDLVHLVLRHRSGASSTATLTLFAPPAASGSEVLCWGDHGVSTMPRRRHGGAVAAFAAAVTALWSTAGTVRPHPCDLRLGVRVVELLEEAEQQLRRR